MNVPKGGNVANVAPVEGFKHQFKKDKKGNITKITWKATGKGIKTAITDPKTGIKFKINVSDPKIKASSKPRDQ